MRHLKSKFFSISVVTGLVFSASTVSVNAEDRVQLYLGGKPKQPSIEVNIGAAYKAKKAADIRLAKERKIKARVQEMVTKEQERILETQAEADSQEKEKLQAELRQAAMMAAEERIARQRAEAEARAVREEAEKIRLAKERLEKERKEAALEKAKKLANSLSQQRKDAAQRKTDEAARIKNATQALQQVDTADTDIIHTPEIQEKVEVSEVADLSELPSELPDVSAEEEAAFVEETEEAIAEIEVIEPKEEIEVTEVKEEKSFFGSLKSIFSSTEKGDEETPKLADVPELDKSRITITDEVEAELEEELQTKLAEVEEIEGAGEESEEALEEIKVVETEEEQPTKLSVPLSMVNKLKSAPAMPAPIVEEEKIVERVEKVEKKVEKKIVEQVMAEEPKPLVIEIPKPEPSGDALSIASMFGAKDEDAPIPSVLRAEEKAEEASDSIATVAETGDGSLLKPQSLIPSILNSKESAAGDKKSDDRMEVASLPSMVKGTTPGVLVSIEFLADSEALPNAVESDLETVVLEMKTDPMKRLSIIGYASNADDTISTARRISLKRALSVRKHLINNGIESTRINVQAMGNAYKGDGSKDRVDVFFIGEKG